MGIVYKCCCGFDVHEREVTVCVITPEGRETRTFRTMTADLLDLADWLVCQERDPCRHGERRRILEAGV